MFYISKFLKFVILLIVISGCSNRSGIPSWNYEIDELKFTSKDLTSFQRIINNDNGGNSKENIWNLTISNFSKSSVKSGIDLTPRDLYFVILDALSKSTKESVNQLFSTFTNTNLIGARWKIVESNEGEITTDWESIPGKTVGLLWWQKKYQTEVHHIITIERSYQISDFSNFSIVTEVRERPNSKYKWSPGDTELGRASFEDIKNTLLQSVNIVLEDRRDKSDED